MHVMIRKSPRDCSSGSAAGSGVQSHAAAAAGEAFINERGTSLSTGNIREEGAKSRTVAVKSTPPTTKHASLVAATPITGYQLVEIDTDRKRGIHLLPDQMISSPPYRSCREDSTTRKAFLHLVSLVEVAFLHQSDRHRLGPQERYHKENEKMKKRHTATRTCPPP